MGRGHAEAAAVIAARPADIYAVLADYRNEHPHILPKAYFSALEVEQGGRGAGTVFRVRTRFLGVERSYHMVVSEPEPGRVLVETDIGSGLATTFTVTPLDNGERARVQIATDWKTSAGLGEMVEKALTPPIMWRIYRAELRQLAAYVQNKSAVASGRTA